MERCGVDDLYRMCWSCKKTDVGSNDSDVDFLGGKRSIKRFSFGGIAFLAS